MYTRLYPGIKLKRKETILEIESKVTKVGNGAHVLVPLQWLGKKVKVILIEKDVSDKDSDISNYRNIT